MKLDAALAGVRSLGIDTAPFIYLIERHPDHLAVVREVVRRIDAGVLGGYSSVLSLTEVLTQPKRLGNPVLEQQYRNLLLNSRNFALLSIDDGIAEEAAELRARHRLRTPDAIQVATALAAGCEAFLTNDHALRRVTELQILVLDDLEL